MNKILKFFLLGFIVVFGLIIQAPQAQAAVTPIALSAVPPVQFPTEKYTITGARISAGWGRHQEIYGLDLGVIGNITDQRFVGIAAAGGFNATHGDTTILGLQLAGLGNYNTNKTSVYGLQAAGLANVNTAASKVVGVQLALANIATHTNIYGVQVGAYNKAQTVYGVQLGVVNVANNLHGIQIGLINFHHHGLIGVSPIINIGF